MTARLLAGFAGVIACCVLMAAAAAEVDPAASRIGFTIKTRWGQTLQGRFVEPTGTVDVLADGRHVVRLRLPTATVEVGTDPTYTRMTRGPAFFDAARYGDVVFVSDPYAATLPVSGGELSGELTIRGHRQREVFTVQPAACEHPGIGCDVVAEGSISRRDYGVDHWSFALSDRVRFSLRVRVLEDVGA